MPDDTEEFLLPSAKLLRIYSENVAVLVHFSDLTENSVLLHCSVNFMWNGKSFEMARKILFFSCAHGIFVTFNGSMYDTTYGRCAGHQ